MRTLRISVAALVVVVGGTQAAAQAWPLKPIRALVPFTAGSGTDVVARLVLDFLSVRLGQPIVVENRLGAGGTIAAAAVAKGSADGYTVLVHSSALTIAPSIYPGLTYDTEHDLLPVIPLGSSPNVLITSPARGINTLRELVATAKAKPEAISFASAGVGTNTHLSAERFRLSAGFAAVHVPFKGGAEAITEVMAGRVEFFFSPIGIVMSHLNEGKLLGLAVNSKKRASALPHVPTTLEAGFADSDYPIWWGLFVSAATPRQIVEKLHVETRSVLEMPRLREKLTVLGVEPMVMTSAEFQAHVRAEIRTNAALVEAAGMKAK